MNWVLVLPLQSLKKKPKPKHNNTHVAYHSIAKHHLKIAEHVCYSFFSFSSNTVCCCADRPSPQTYRRSITNQPTMLSSVLPWHFQSGPKYAGQQPLGSVGEQGWRQGCPGCSWLTDPHTALQPPRQNLQGPCFYPVPDIPCTHPALLGRTPLLTLQGQFSPISCASTVLHSLH